MSNVNLMIMLSVLLMSAKSAQCIKYIPFVDVYPNATPSLSSGESFPLYFGLMLSLSGDQQSTGALAGVQAALDHINSRDDLLPGYSLHYTLTDSKVRPNQMG